FFTIPFILFFKDSFSQNLVPNPSFEEIWECPGLSGNILPPYETEISLKQWSLPTLGTSDYYHICGTASSSSVPTNWMGYQYPRTGDAYTGFIAFNTVYASAAEYDYKEYLQCKL